MLYFVEVTVDCVPVYGKFVEAVTPHDAMNTLLAQVSADYPEADGANAQPVADTGEYTVDEVDFEASSRYYLNST